MPSPAIYPSPLIARPASASKHCSQLNLTMQSLPDARQQSFEELYGPPENFLEIEVTATTPPHPSTPRQSSVSHPMRRSATP